MEVVVEKFNPWKDSLIIGALMLVVGILLAVFQDESLKWILIIAGVFTLLYGIIAIVEGMKSKFTLNIAIGVIAAVFGLALIVCPNFFEDLLMILLALSLIIVGLVSLLSSGSGFAMASGTRLINIVFSAVLVVLGILALLNLDDTADVVMIIIGVMLAVMGLLKMYGAYNLKKISS